MQCNAMQPHLVLFLSTFTLSFDYITVMENLTVQQLESELKTVVNWFQLGIQLEIPPDILKAIRSDRRDTAECRLELFMKWKDRERPTWQKVVKALSNIGLNRLAKDISEKYLGSLIFFQ